MTHLAIETKRFNRPKSVARRCRTDFLYAIPRFSSGMASVLDLFGVFDQYNTSRSPAEADARALYSDLWVASKDFKRALEAYGLALAAAHADAESVDDAEARDRDLLAAER